MSMKQKAIGDLPKQQEHGAELALAERVDPVGGQKIRDARISTEGGMRCIT